MYNIALTGQIVCECVLHREFLILLLRRLNIATDYTEQIFLYKAEDWAVASATAIDDNAADGGLGK